MSTYKSVLFVCWGNVCRSPSAELMLKNEIKRSGADNVRIESAGVGADHDTARPSFSMWIAALLRGLWLRPTPRLFRRQDFSKFDLIVAMDREVRDSIGMLAREEVSNVKLLSDFLPLDWPLDVPDPMNRPFGECNRVLDMLDKGCGAIGAQLMPG
ncbi:MAG: low molecular weight phosphotyrosine protein phosphatase [Planctomycetota bacterium]